MNLPNEFDTESNLFIGLFDAMPFSVYVADVTTHELIFINKKLRERISSSANQKCYKAIYQLHSPCINCPINKLIDRDGLPTGETLISELFNDVDDHWYQLQDKCICWPDGKVAKYSIGVDITKQKQAQNLLAEAHAELALKAKALKTISITDPLTQLFNRLKMDEVLEYETSRANRYAGNLSVILLDLDKFKLVNDTFGHLVGDKVLCETATILQNSVRKQDYVARWGGEEFVVVCPETNLDETLLVAEKIRLALCQNTFTEVKLVTGSLGVASYIPNESVNALMANADKALYQAKDNGRNRVCKAF